MSQKVMEIVTSKIIEALEKGTAPWKQSWASSRSRNIISGKPYSGANALFTHPMVTGFKKPGFLTRNQINKLGATIKDGERYLPILFYGSGKNEETNKEYRFTRFYKIWNTSQIEGLSFNDTRETEKNQSAEDVLNGWVDRPRITTGPYNPCYGAVVDTVYMPEQGKFNSDGEYYSALFHELVHSTGNKKRLDRDLKPLMLDSHSYSKEELIAEIGSAFLCHHTGVKGVIENQAAYCQSWLKALKNDREFILKAAREADKAFRMITEEASNGSSKKETPPKVQA